MDQIFVQTKHLLVELFPAAWQPLVSALISTAAIIGVFASLFAVTTILERKGLGRIQNRYGPNRVGPFGLLQPLAEGIPALPARQAETLQAVRGLSEEQPTELLAITNAVQSLLARTATETGPLALIVDDAAWVDRSSAEVLGTLARSPHSGPIAVLSASRTGDESLLSNIGIPEYEVRPLDDVVDGREPVEIYGAGNLIEVDFAQCELAHEKRIEIGRAVARNLETNRRAVAPMRELAGGPRNSDALDNWERLLIAEGVQSVSRQERNILG